MMKSIISLAILAAATTPAGAAPVEFSSIDAQTDPANSPELSCDKRGEYWDCELSRDHFADIPINWSNVSVRPEDRKITVITFTFDRMWFDRAAKAFEAKYGKPSRSIEKELINKTGGPYLSAMHIWGGFDSGSIMLSNDEDESSAYISFGQPDIGSNEPNVDF